MPKENHEPQQNLEQEFSELKSELLNQMSTTIAKQLTNTSVISIRVVPSGADGGDHALILGSDGEWSSKVLMTGFDIKDQSFKGLIRVYAEIKDRDYKEIWFGKGGNSKEAKEYLRKNEKKLSDGLVFEMKTTLDEIKKRAE